MSLYKGLCAVLVAGLMGSALLAAKPAAPAAGDQPVARRRAVRLTKPWSELKDLSEAEKAKILEIHQKAVEGKKEIEAKEHQDILALLTPEQQTEVAKVEENEKQLARQGRSRTPTTRPSGSSEK